MVTKGHWGDSYGYLLQYNAGRVAFGVGAGGTASKSILVHTPKEFGDGQWHHAAAVVDRSGQTIRAYVDGVAQPLLLSSAYCGALADSVTLDISGCPAIDGTSWDPLTIGSYNGAREFFDGSVDDVRIYLKPLSGPEVDALVTAGG